MDKEISGSVVLISIRPQFVEKILSGEKRFEFRKTRFRRKVSRVVIYATAPISRIVAVAEVDNVHEGPPSDIWTLCTGGSGISRQLFRQYFQSSDVAVALEISEVRPLGRHYRLDELTKLSQPPQSFCYLGEANLEALL